VEVRSVAERRTADLEVKIRSTEAHSVDVIIADEKRLRDFDSEVIGDLAELRALYECNTQTIGGLCSPMPEGEPSTANYLHWLSIEISGPLDMFGGANENFVTHAVEGTLLMAKDSVDLDAVQSTAAESGADVLPAKRDVWRAARSV
jgi:hypothetical protein